MGNNPSISCGQGTQIEGSQCVPKNTLSCGEGTYREDREDGSYCVADMFVGSTLSCGQGTKVVQNECVCTFLPSARGTGFNPRDPLKHVHDPARDSHRREANLSRAIQLG